MVWTFADVTEIGVSMVGMSQNKRLLVCPRQRSWFLQRIFCNGHLLPTTTPHDGGARRNHHRVCHNRNFSFSFLPNQSRWNRAGDARAILGDPCVGNAADTGIHGKQTWSLGCWGKKVKEPLTLVGEACERVFENHLRNVQVEGPGA